MTWSCMYNIPKNKQQKTPGTTKALVAKLQVMINIQKSIIFQYTSNEQLKFEMKNNTIYITTKIT